MSRRLPDELVGMMHAEYLAGASLHQLGRKYHRDRRSLRELFERRGLEIRPPHPMGAKDPKTGRILPARRFTKREINAIIAKANKVRIPDELRLEWRKWSLEQRADFVRRIRAKLKNPSDMPKGPLSRGLEAFDYGSPRAHAIAARLNKGCDSRGARMKLDLCSQGVIYRNELWFWSHKVGYQRGPWSPENGRPSLHKFLWESHYKRKVPPGHVIRFADGNRNNHAISNLVLLDRDEVCRENQAASLARKSRERLQLLLNTNRKKRNASRNTLTQILDRR